MIRSYCAKCGHWKRSWIWREEDIDYLCYHVGTAFSYEEDYMKRRRKVRRNTKVAGSLDFLLKGHRAHCLMVVVATLTFFLSWLRFGR